VTPACSKKRSCVRKKLPLIFRFVYDTKKVAAEAGESIAVTVEETTQATTVRSLVRSSAVIEKRKLVQQVIRSRKRKGN